MTDAVIVLRKLTVLLEHVSRMKRRREAEFPSFVRDVDLQDALSMSFLVAVQEAIDIALHIAADEGWGIPASYAESFELLAAHGFIGPELAAMLSQMARLRNRMAHGYAGVDIDRLFQELPAGILALESYAAAIGQRLRKSP